MPLMSGGNISAQSERVADSSSPSSGTDHDGEYPFIDRFLEIGSLRYHYVDEGPSVPKADKPAPDSGPLLFVHGNPTWSFAWRNFIKAFSPQRRCLAVDHIGCGRSDKPQTYEYTLANHVANLTQFIDDLDLQNITLVGHDWGGCIGMGAAVARPERFSRFVLANTAAFRSTRIPWRIAVCRLPVFGTFAVRGLNGFAAAAQWMAVTHRLSPSIRRGYLEPYDSWNNRVATHEFVRDIPLKPSHRSHQTLVGIEEGLEQFADHPMLLCWGEQDWCFTPAFLDEWRRRFPGARVQTYPTANHYVFEDAGELMIAQVREFLSETATGTSPGVTPVTTS